MKNYVTFSMGICSAYIAARLAETCQNPVCVWSDTGGEDEDTYRFGREQECFGFFADRGIPAPRMYRHFRHANCLPCKNFGVNDWQALRYYYPTRFGECLVFENTSGLKWMQDGPYLRDLPEWTPPKRRRGSLGYHEPVFNFDMGCDVCSRD